jgi:hypothetical protein
VSQEALATTTTAQELLQDQLVMLQQRSSLVES